ncbi:hypothetical protein BDV41DRAFT_547653 [Aspergillus transmontanensis]|uniref:Uncharacterized protein n=1 Tax=Aspergillus transmontanensis TaxID=1034304 RepID=A0A5N6VMR0_9EURO|nr:hypothetical protein BDV41DRAFT_547653 [Aspergillus transmontanensis]
MASTRNSMPRRAHTKSRNGCVQCKQRHIKVVCHRIILPILKPHRPHCLLCSISLASQPSSS